MRQLVRQAQITLDDQVQLVELLRLQRVPAGRAARAAVCLVVPFFFLARSALQLGQVLGVRELLQVSAPRVEGLAREQVRQLARRDEMGSAGGWERE